MIKGRGVRGVAGLVLSAVTLQAQEAFAVPTTSGGGLQIWDWAVIGGYLAVVLGLGWFYSRQTTDSRDYFIASRKTMPSFWVGISIYATLLSTITYLGKPGEIINRGPMLIVGQLITIPFVYWIVGHVIIPRLMRERVTRAYEQLELRLGPSVRLLGAGLFVGLRLIWMGLLIYLSSVALTVIFGLDAKWTPMVSLVTGFIAVVYTAIGGLRTVIITDAIQFGLLFLGAVMVIVIVSMRLNGFSWMPTEWSPHWDEQPWITFDPHVRVSVLGTIISMGLWAVATAGGDQTAVQRYMATADVRAARRSYLVNAVAMAVVSLLLGALGLALLAFYTQVPGTLGEGMTIAADADRLFPYFIAHHLPVGLAGLVVSAAIAAAMSSVDSGVNSITAVTMSDFLPRLGWRPKSVRATMLFSKLMAGGIGTTVVLASMLVQHVPGNFVGMTSRTANLVVVPLFVLFVFALWVPRATPLAAWLGAAYGLTAATLIAFWDGITGGEPISFQWMALGALVANLAVGLTLSQWGPRREETRKSWIVGAVGAGALVAIVAGLVG